MIIGLLKIVKLIIIINKNFALLIKNLIRNSMRMVLRNLIMRGRIGVCLIERIVLCRIEI